MIRRGTSDGRIIASEDCHDLLVPVTIQLVGEDLREHDKLAPFASSNIGRAVWQEAMISGFVSTFKWELGSLYEDDSLCTPPVPRIDALTHFVLWHVGMRSPIENKKSK